MAHYKFIEGVYFVQGALRGAILDTNTGNVYSVNQTAVSIITGQTKNEKYWLQFESMGLVCKSDNKTGLPELPTKQPIGLSFVWFEINTSDCNEYCIHCYPDSMPLSRRRELMGVEQTKLEQAQSLPFSTWCSLIQESYNLGCRRCQFIGGEPFIYRDGNKTVLDLAEYAINVGYEMVEIFTNATMLTRKAVTRIKALGLKIAVSLYSHDETVHDRITRTPGGFKKTMQGLELLKEFGIPTRVEIVGMRANEATLADTVTLIKDLGFRNRGVDPLRPKGRGDNPILAPSPGTVVRYGMKTRPNFKASRELLTKYISGHACLAGKITITETGDILPCIFTRNHIIGNIVQAGSLEAVLVKNQLQEIWHSTKDDVLVCQDCEYRYVCFDCRPLSEAIAGGQAGYLNAPYPRCTYNPYQGTWNKGVWRMKGGQPHYDQQIAETIELVIST